MSKQPKANAPFEATHHIAIDGSQRGSACSIVPAGVKITAASAYKVGGVENIGGFGPLLDLARGARPEGRGDLTAEGTESAERNRRDAETTLVRPLALIECPDWTGRGTREVKSSVTAWESHLMRLFPKRRILRVAPKEWQTALFGKRESRFSDDTKVMSRWYVEHVLHMDCHGDHDIADSLCLLAYLRLMERLR